MSLTVLMNAGPWLPVPPTVTAASRVSGIAHAHLHRTLTELRARDDIDLVHDHVEVVGLSTFATTCRPTLHTRHWDLGKHREFYSTLDCGRRLWLNGVSADQLRKADPAIQDNPDVRYWCNEIAPHIDDHQVRWLGTIDRDQRDDLLATARAALFPIT